MRNTTLTLILLLCCHGILFSQFTPCDDLPGIIKSYKPSLTADIPAWARPLYRYPVNYDSVCTGFSEYMKSHPGEKSPVIRYFRMWQRAVEGYVQEDGWVVVRKADEGRTEGGREADEKRTEGGRKADEKRTEGGRKADGMRTESGRDADGKRTEGGRDADGRRTGGGRKADGRGVGVRGTEGDFLAE